MSSPPPSPVQEQPLLAQPSLGAAATAPLLEEPYCGSPAMISDEDLREDPWPEGMLRATPDKPAFSKTPSPNKEFQEQVDLLDQTAPPTLTSSFTRDRVSTAAATTARATRLSRRARRHGLPTPSSKGSPCRAAAAGRSGALLSLTTLPAIRFPSVTSRRRRVPLSSPRLAAASTTCPRSSSTSTSKMRKRREHFWSSVW